MAPRKRWAHRPLGVLGSPPLAVCISGAARPPPADWPPGWQSSGCFGPRPCCLERRAHRAQPVLTSQRFWGPLLHPTDGGTRPGDKRTQEEHWGPPGFGHQRVALPRSAVQMAHGNTGSTRSYKAIRRLHVMAAAHGLRGKPDAKRKVGPQTSWVLGSFFDSSALVDIICRGLALPSGFVFELRVTA